MKQWLLCSVLVLSSLEANTPEAARTQAEETVYSWLRTFAEGLEKAMSKHYKVDHLEQCMIKGIDSFFNCLDPHSNLLDPKTYKSMLDMTSGEFFGIGVVIDNTRTSKDKFLNIVDVIVKGPADKEGLKPHDKIVEIDGVSLEGLSTDEATLKLKGPRNTKVTVKVLRENQPDLLTFEITRDVIKEQNSLCFFLPDYNVYYISLTTFSENSVRAIEQLLKKAQSKKYRALILDLRNNSGGLLSAAIDIGGLFLKKGSLIVTTKDKNSTVTDRFVTSRKPISTGRIPIFILVNNYTASAGEILAGALQLHAKQSSLHPDSKKINNPMVFLVGTRTFGKGSVQQVIPISNNCAIKLTTDLYFLPGDISIQGQGIVPDFEIERRLPLTEQVQWFNKNYGREQALTNYIKVHEEDEKKQEAEKEKSDKDKTWTERMQGLLETDNQLREALTLINMLDQAQRRSPLLVASRSAALEYLQSIYIGSAKIKLSPVTM